MRLALIILFLLSFQALAQRALVLIDMQEKFIARKWDHVSPASREKFRQVVANQIEFIRAAKEKNLPIVIVYYTGYGALNPDIQTEIAYYPNLLVTNKNSDSLFADHNYELGKVRNFLRERHVTELLVAGANGSACVQGSIQDALKKGYDVTACANLIADFNYSEYLHPYAYEEDEFVIPNSRTFRCEPNLKP